MQLDKDPFSLYRFNSDWEHPINTLDIKLNHENTVYAIWVDKGFLIKGKGKISRAYWECFKSILLFKNKKDYSLTFESNKILLPDNCEEFFRFLKLRIRLPEDLDVLNVKNMGAMFECTNFNGNISRWDVSNVKYMNSMFFENRFFNCDISKWNVSNVKNVFAMLAYAPNFKKDLSNWKLKLPDERYFEDFSIGSNIKEEFLPIPKYERKKI